MYHDNKLSMNDHLNSYVMNNANMIVTIDDNVSGYVMSYNSVIVINDVS